MTCAYAMRRLRQPMSEVAREALCRRRRGFAGYGIRPTSKPIRLMPLAPIGQLAACGGSKPYANGNPTSACEAHSFDLGPFFHAETLMDQKMREVVGTYAGNSWARKMIEHHRGTIVMTDVLLHRTGDSTDIQGQALRTKIEQQRDILPLAQMLRREKVTHQPPAGR